MIYEQIDDIIMHKGREEIDMPGLLVNKILIDLPRPARKVYRDMQDEYLSIVEEDIVTAANAAVMSGKLKQISNGAVYDEEQKVGFVHDNKIEAITELVEGLEGQALLVFYEFRHDLSRLQTAFPEAPFLGGGTKPSESKKIIDGWNAGEIPILFLHPGSAGHGLNLQDGGCHDVCWFSITWDQELHEQATSRVWRQGVDDDVTAHYLVCRDTIDEHIMQILDGKANLQNALLNALKK